MTYASGRPMLDADSHLMELPGFLDPYIERDLRDELKGREMTRLASRLDAAVAAAERRRMNPQQRADAEERLLQDKGWNAMGSFDSGRAKPRARPLRLRRPARVRHLRDRRSSSARTKTSSTQAAPHTTTRSSTSARTTTRLLPVAYVPLVDPDRAVRAPAKRRSISGPPRSMCRRPRPASARPTHPDLFPFWEMLGDSGVPVRAPRRGRRPPARPRLPQQRHAGDRSPRRWREHPLEGLPRDRQLAVPVPRHAHPRRPLRPVPRRSAAASSRKARAGWCRGCTSSTSRSARSGAPRSRCANLAAAPVGVRAQAPQVHAVPR